MLLRSVKIKIPELGFLTFTQTPRKQMKKDIKIDNKHFRVTIFGSARIKENDWEYKLVYKLAELIAKEGLDIVTGGGPGLMQAASRGHHTGRGKNNNNNVHSVGLTINLPREEGKGYHLDIRKDFNKFSGRLDKFMELSNVVVVAPGGIGTLLELFYTWQLMQVKHICETPIILLGDKWDDLLTWMRKNLLKKKLIGKEDFDFIFTAKDEKEAMKIIAQAHNDFQKGGHVCKNFEKYGKN